MEFVKEWLPSIWAYMGESRILGAFIIVASSLLIAWLVNLVMDRVLLVLARRSKFHLDDAILRILDKPIWVSVVLLGALTAVRWISPAPPFTFVFTALLKSFLALIWVFTINRILLRVADDWIRHWREAGRQGSEIIRLSGNIVRILILVGAMFFILSFWKINVTPLLASAGIAGVAVALAAKETLSNFFGGVSVLLDQPYAVGDYIILDSGERGEVMEIGLRSTRVRTRDDVQISIPNAIITNTKIINESAPEPRFRIRVKVGVAYGTDVDQVERVLLSVAGANPLVVSNPEPRVRFRTFGDSSLDFELLCWAHDPRDKGRLIHELNRNVYKAFERDGIIIPFPQRDVHVHSHEGEQPPDTKHDASVKEQRQS
ncbi:MAG: mechanosensitive ion channel family protein [Deltaproteobacteria bacterium]|nr:MAG: mechanosensitive ion channel family protein [Deltaproteobacteria bacterium]